MMHINKLAHTAYRAILCLSLTGLSSMAQAQDGQAQTLPTVQLTAGIHTIKAMVAVSPEERQIGLMFRREMKPNEGMLFVFEAAAPQCFWMKNTVLPLSAAFLGDDGRVINIEEMAPQTLDSHCSKKPARYVLEMNQGWFARHGVKPGDKLGGIPSAKAP